MTTILASDVSANRNNLLYVQNSLAEIIKRTGSTPAFSEGEGRCALTLDINDGFAQIMQAELADKLAETVAINYKYEYFKRNLTVNGLCEQEKEILFAAVIAADLDEDKRYVFSKIKGQEKIVLDGVYNFRLQALKYKWKDVLSFVPATFTAEQLKEFILYLTENRRKRAYVDDGKVYDEHFRRLKRRWLLGGEGLDILREILLSGCGEVEIKGRLPEDDEFYLKQYFCDKIFFATLP